jgi:glutamate synthase domain-containing protein 3
LKIDARGLAFRELNEKVREAVKSGATEIELHNVNGQRFIGDGLTSRVNIIIRGPAGNDLGAFMSGPRILVKGNVADAAGNTMNEGEIVVDGRAGDVIGHSMRGGRILVRGSVGYRVGLHMKAYKDKNPTIIVGGTAEDFLGEYQAGGTIVVLAIEQSNGRPIGDFAGTGMHGGRIFVNGTVSKSQLGVGATTEEVTEADSLEIRQAVEDYCRTFNTPMEKIPHRTFTKIVPISSRPYGRTYAIQAAEIPPKT